jgi:hypothetical protein
LFLAPSEAAPLKNEFSADELLRAGGIHDVANATAEAAVHAIEAGGVRAHQRGACSRGPDAAVVAGAQRSQLLGGGPLGVYLWTEAKLRGGEKVKVKGVSVEAT